MTAIDALCEEWLAPVIARVEADPRQYRPKQINDPVWGAIDLRPAEVALLDAPLLQRMRGVRQLGLAQLVFPSATHDRLEHIIGVLGSVDRICDALNRQIDYWNSEHKRAGEAIPLISSCQRRGLRLAAMFHDIGHGPFSHALEPVLDVTSPLSAAGMSEDSSWRSDLAALRQEIMRTYQLNSRPATSEVIAVAIVLSGAVGTLLAHPLFATEEMSGSEIQEWIVACLIGAVEGPGATHLSTLISGQVDADRLDYLVRDAHHAGLQIGFDTHRLLSKLEVLQVRDSNLKSADDAFRARIARAEHGVLYTIGIAASGYGSFEQMLIGRTFLYDRLYHHHKIRAAEAMAQRMLLVAERDRGRRFELGEIFLSVGDDTFIRIIAGEITHPRITTSSEAAARLARGILTRDLLHRAFAFRGRLIGAPPGLDDAITIANRDRQWRDVVKATGDLKGRYKLGCEIHDLAMRIAEVLARSAAPEEGERLHVALERCGPEQVIVDLPANKADAIRILARYPDESLKAPEFSFNPHKWTEAYEQQKRTGYVFCPKDCVPAVALASKIVFLSAFGIAMGEDADGYIKASKTVDATWLQALKEEGLLDQATADALTTRRYSLLRVREEDLALPSLWIEEDPDIAAKLMTDVNSHLRGGLTIDGLKALSNTLKALWHFIDTWYSGKRITSQITSEAELQTLLAEHLRTAGLTVIEGAEVGGGELDLFVDGHVMVENKFNSGETSPGATGRHAGVQGRRYLLALRGQVVIVVNAYRHKTGQAVPSRSQVVKVSQIAVTDGNRVEIRIDLPFGCPKPSEDKS